MKYALKQLSELLEVPFEGNPEHEVTGVADLASAQKSDLSFFGHSPLGKSPHPSLLESSQAGIICIYPKGARIEGQNYLLCPNPELAFQTLVEKMLPNRFSTGFSGIHPTAVIHESAALGKNVTISPYAVIDQEAVIGNNVIVGAGAYIGFGVHLDDDVIIHAHATIREHCKVGKRSIIQPGVVIGSCGYGYTQNAQGEHIKLTHLGTVEIEEDVEIGANTAVDRGRFKPTTIKRGTKIDNLVQIAHNVVIGEHNIIVGQTGIAGSTSTGKYVMIGGQVAVDGHLQIGDFVMIAARSGVSKSLFKPGKYGGVPALSMEKNNRLSVMLRNIDKYIDKLKALEEKVLSM